MSVREKINERPLVAGSIGGGLVLVIIIWSMLGQSGAHGPVGGGSDQAFFSVDDGKTWFKESEKKLPPFNYNGKDAYRAHVFECGGKEFVSYLERYTPDGLKALNASNNPSAAPKSKAANRSLYMKSIATREVKRPGESKWLPADDGVPPELLAPKCPDGKGTANMVLP